MANVQKKFLYYDFLKKLCENDYKQIELNHFIENLFLIAANNLRHHSNKLSKAFEIQELSFDCLAIDAIAPFFHPDKNGNFSILTNEYKRWKPPVNSEESALFFIGKLVSLRVEQHICKVYREVDPLYAKLLDSVNYLIKSKGYKKIFRQGESLVTFDIQTDSNMNIITDEEFQKIPQQVFRDGKNVLENLFTYLKDDAKYSPAVPVTSLVSRLKQVILDQYDNEIKSISSQPSYETKDIINKAIDFIHQKIKTSYRGGKKLSECECDAFCCALKDIAMDLKDGGQIPGLFGYLKPYIKGLTIESYKKNYHNKLEYLVSLLKEKVISGLLPDNAFPKSI